MKKYSKILCLDVDTLCMGDISFLFKYDFPLAVSIAGGDYEKHQTLQGFYKRIYWNSGIMVIGDQLISKKKLTTH